MKYKLLAADIDGTLLNSKSELTDETADAIRAAIDSGVYFVLSTGRPYQGITKFIKRLGLENMPYILYNGAMVMLGGEVIYSLTLSQKSARIIADEGHKRNSTMVCWAENQLYSEVDNDKVRFYKSISGVEPIILSDIGTLGEKITKYVWYDDVERTNKNHLELKKLYSEEINIHPSRVDFLEFVNKSCSKATAMQILSDRLGIKREEMIAVGDGFNDLPMLEYAGLGVAMDNAAPEVKNRCGFVTSSCDEFGVKRLIERFIL